ncbi:uncharacterized protein ACRADG_008152 [Cochliomyia hominivorax]
MAQRISCIKSRTDTRQKCNESKQYKTAATRELNDFPIDTNYQIKNEIEYEEVAQEMDEANVNDDSYFWASGDNSYEEDIQGDSHIWESSNNMEINDDNPSNNLSKIYEVENRCAVCKRKFSFQRDLVKHVKENHPIDKAYKCRHCSTLFSKLKSVSTHLKRCHADLANAFSCDYCSKSFFRKSLLERHRLVHSEYIEESNSQPHNEQIEDNNSTDVSEDIFERRKGKIYPVEDKCGICKKKFSPQKNLVKHVQEMHSNDKAYKCLYCPTLFSKLKSVTTHYKRGHSKMPKKIVCEVCGMFFYTNFLLERHRRVHMEVRPFGCNKCDKTYKYKRNLLVHMKTHLRNNNKNIHNSNNKSQDNNAEEYCEYDEEYYENEEQHDEENESEDSDEENQFLDNEYYGNDGLHLFKGDEYYENDDDDDDILPNDDYVTNHDHYKFADKEEESIQSINDQEQYNNSSSQNPFKCNVCGNVYKYKKSLKYHQKKHHSNVEQRDSIVIDDTPTDNINNFGINANSTYFIIDEFNTDTENFDELENEYFVPSASVAYTNEYTYEEYNPQSSEISAGINQHECGVCSKIFNCQQAVAKHLQRCHPEIEFFKCPYCDDNFYSLLSLSQHIKAAKHPQKRNVCDICLKSFERNSDLRRHKNVHTNERPYVCSICQKTFKLESHLKRHTAKSHSWINSPNLYSSIY